MNSEKRKDDLMKQGRGLATLSVWLIIFALVLGAVLLDICFVPSGELWKEVKSKSENSIMLDYDERGKEHDDKEMWEIIKTGMVEEKVVPFKSGFLCWAVIQIEVNKEIKQEQQRAEARKDALIKAQTAMECFDEYLSEKEIYIYTDSVQSIDFYLHNKRIYTMFKGVIDADEIFLSDEELDELETILLDVFPNVNEAALKVYVFGSECTAAVFAPDVSRVVEGNDFPCIDEYGHFDPEKVGNMSGPLSQMHTNGWVIGYVDKAGYVGLIV